MISTTGNDSQEEVEDEEQICLFIISVMKQLMYQTRSSS